MHIDKKYLQKSNKSVDIKITRIYNVLILLAKSKQKQVSINENYKSNNRGEIKMKAKEALENIAVDFDTSGMEPTTLGDKNPDLHFAERYKEEMKVILAELEATNKKLSLYKQLFDELNMSIEFDTTDVDDHPQDYEYLEQSPASEKALQLFKQIQEIEKDESSSEIDVSEFSDLVSDEATDKMVDEMFPELHPAEEKEDKTVGNQEKQLIGTVNFITKKEGLEIQSSFNQYSKSDKDHSLFLYQDEYKWIAIDNTTGDAFTEEFDYLIEAINWLLKGDNENE